MTGFLVDPWLRIHPDDVERGTPATLVRGVDVPVLFDGPERRRYAKQVRPASVVSVERHDSGDIAIVRVLDESNDDGGGGVVSLGQWPSDDPRPHFGEWSVVVGARHIQPLRRIAVVIDAGTLRYWRRFGVPSTMRTASNVDEVFVTNESDARAHVFDGMRVMGKPDRGLIEIVRAQVRP